MQAVTGWQFETITDDRSPPGDGLIHAVIVAAVVENPLLALVNNFAFPLNSQIVTAVQLLITLAAVAVIAVRRPPMSRMFVVAGCLFLCCALFKFIVTGSINPRFFYDAAMLPLFLMLGASAHTFSVRFVGIIVILLLAVAVAELIFPDVYADVLNPRKYFYFTRDWVAAVTAPDASIASSSDFYVGAIRYTGSFFGVAHRAGSLFLEPLSVGYLGIICAIIFLHAPDLAGRDRILLILCCVGLALLSDTRVAVFLILAAVVMRTLAGKIPLSWLIGAPYGVLLAVVVLYMAAQAMPGDLGLRLGVTAEPLMNAAPLNILFGGVDDAKVADSGIVYLIANAGLIGFCVYPLLASGLFSGEDSPSPVAVSMFLYLLVALAFGYAPMSIKTACFLGYGVGTLTRVRTEIGECPAGLSAATGRS